MADQVPVVGMDVGLGADQAQAVAAAVRGKLEHAVDQLHPAARQGDGGLGEPESRAETTAEVCRRAGRRLGRRRTLRCRTGSAPVPSSQRLADARARGRSSAVSTTPLPEASSSR